MCNNWIVSLLFMSTVCWANPPAPGQDPWGIEAKAATQEVQSPSLKAYDPSPPNGACGVADPLLSWKPGDTAFLHNFYFGTDPALGPANLVGRFAKAQTLYYIGVLPPGTYYWRVDEIEQDGATLHAGDIWCFTIGTGACDATAPYRVVNLCCDPALVWPPAANGARTRYISMTTRAKFSIARRPRTRELRRRRRSLSDRSPAERPTTGASMRFPRRARSLRAPCGVFSTTICGGGGVLREWWLNIEGHEDHRPDGQPQLSVIRAPPGVSGLHGGTDELGG